MIKFTESHEWIDIDATQGIGIVGITQYAQKELGDVVYVELPIVGRQVKQGQEAAVLESTKAAADVYAPVAGEIIAVNQDLKQSPEWINQKPEKEGWIFKIKLADQKELAPLMDRAAYEAKWHSGGAH